MYTVVLVGAGATLAEALPGRPSREERPPLDGSFFDLCRLAKLDGRTKVRHYMTRRYGVDPFDGSASMEQVFNFLHADAMSPKSSDECVQAYWLLLRMYAAAITRTTRTLKGTSQAGIGALLRQLWRSGSHQFDIVTFNQDIVVENALQEMANTVTYSDVPWGLQDCYMTGFEDYWRPSAGPYFDAKSELASPVRVLKLHGSLNWVYQARSSEDARNAIRSPKGRPGCLIARDLPLELRGVTPRVDESTSSPSLCRPSMRRPE